MERKVHPVLLQERENKATNCCEKGGFTPSRHTRKKEEPHEKKILELGA